MKKWENLNLYKDGKEVAIPDNFENGGNYLFSIVARFNNIQDADYFAKFKSYTTKPWLMFSVTKNLIGDSLGEYYVYEIISLI